MQIVNTGSKKFQAAYVYSCLYGKAAWKQERDFNRFCAAMRLGCAWIAFTSPTAFQAASPFSGCLNPPISASPKINALQNKPRLTKPNKSLASRAKPTYNARLLGQIAQSVEQRIENPCVGSSILPLATKFQPEQPALFRLFCVNRQPENDVMHVSGCPQCYFMLKSTLFFAP